TDRPAHHAVGVVPTASLGPRSHRGGAPPAGALRPQGAFRPAGSRDLREHDRLPRPGASGRRDLEPPDPAFGERGEDDPPGHRPVLGDRRRVPQPARRGGRCRVLHRLRLPQGDGMSGADVRATHLTVERVRVGQELAPLVHDVTATTIELGALASRDWRPMHHDHDFAVPRNGTRDIFMNTPTQAAWFERYLTDWTGPEGRLGRMRFRMLGSVFPGDTMVLAGVVRSVDVHATG